MCRMSHLRLSHSGCPWIWSNYSGKVLLYVSLKARKSLQIQSLALLPVVKSVCSRLYRLGEAWDFPNVSRALHPELERRHRYCGRGTSYGAYCVTPNSSSLFNFWQGKESPQHVLFNNVHTFLEEMSEYLTIVLFSSEIHSASVNIFWLAYIYLTYLFSVISS